MKLKLKKISKPQHLDVVSRVSWSPNNVLYSLSDDKTVLTWDLNGEYVNKFQDLDGYYTCLEWGPNLKSGSELLALGSSDGQLKLVNKNGKTDKVLNEAHSNAILCIKWTMDGNGLATSGEDGQVKIWSRQAVLRANLAQCNSPVFAIAWSYDENYLLYSNDKNIFIKPVLKGGLKTISWKAHDEIVLCVDWSAASKLIVSGGEDRKFKVSKALII